MKAGKTFTFEELRRQVLSEHKDFTDEEIEASIHILEHLGILDKISKDIYRTTGKEPKDVV
jgi:hypothetical protein